jgi:hypothetical protein
VGCLEETQIQSAEQHIVQTLQLRSWRPPTTLLLKERSQPILDGRNPPAPNDLLHAPAVSAASDIETLLRHGPTRHQTRWPSRLAIPTLTLRNSPYDLRVPASPINNTLRRTRNICCKLASGCFPYLLLGRHEQRPVYIERTDN